MIHIGLLARIFLQKNNHCEYSQAKKKTSILIKKWKDKNLYIWVNQVQEKNIS